MVLFWLWVVLVFVVVVYRLSRFRVWRYVGLEVLDSIV